MYPTLQRQASVNDALRLKAPDLASPSKNVPHAELRALHRKSRGTPPLLEGVELEEGMESFLNDKLGLPLWD